MITDQQILKYLEGKATSFEVQDIKAWIASNDDNRTYFESIERIFIASQTLSDYKHVDAEAEWNEFSNLINKTDSSIATQAKPEYIEENATSTIVETKKSRFLPYSIAATLTILIASLFYLQGSKQTTETQLVETILAETSDRKDLVQLPDQSIIILNENSAFEYPSSFDKEGDREIHLIKGSASFDIAHDPNKKFIVNVDGLGVEVMGTVFKILKLSESKTQVNLKSGSIKAYELSNPSNNIILSPGDKIVYNNTNFSRIDPTKSRSAVVVSPIKKLESIRPMVVALASSKPEITVPAIIEPEAKISTFRLGDVIDLLKKKYGKKVKFERRLGIDKEQRISIDINQDDLQTIILELEKLTPLRSKPGECDDCYTISSTNKK